MWALKTLRRAGRQATPDLLAILEDTTEHWNQRSGALSTLRHVEADPSVLIPVLDKLSADPVIGTSAALEARLLRNAAEAQQYRESQRAFAATRLTEREVQKAEFQPSSSFLERSSLWGSAGARPSTPGVGTNRPPPPTDDFHGAATRSSILETNNAKASPR
jgi:hypothetical protein